MPATETIFAPRLVTTTERPAPLILRGKPASVEKVSRKASLAFWHRVTISRATDSLCKLGYIERKPDHRDKRSVVLVRTSAGIHFLSEFADMIQAERP